MNKKNVKNLKVFISSAMAIVTVLTTATAVIKLNKKSEYENKNINLSTSTLTSDLSVNELETIIGNTNLYEENTYIQSEYESVDGITYEEIKQNLNYVLSSKEISPEVNQHINEMFDDLNNNYDSTYLIYKDLGMKNKESYMQFLTITIKNNIDKIVIVDSNSDLGREYNIQNVKGLFLQDEKAILINSQYISEVKEILLHEILHSSQNEKIIQDRTNLSYGMFKILTEGESANSSVLLSSNIEFNTGKYIENQNTNCFMYAPDSTNNIYYSRYYNMLCILAGVDVMNSFKENGYNETVLINELSSKYNMDATSFLNKIEDVTMMIEDNPAIVLNQIIEIEQQFLECLNQDVIKADTREEIDSLLRIYRDYKLQYGMRCRQDSVDVTRTLLGIDKLENNLRSKVLNANLFATEFDDIMFDVILLNVGELVTARQERSIDDILYFETEESLIFFNKHTKDSKIYSKNEQTLKFYEGSEDVYLSASPIVNSESQKKM